MYTALKYQNNLAIITLKRPEARNALNTQMIEQLQEIISEIALKNLRAAIFTGDNKAFCAGADITGNK
ncbi:MULTISPECIES: enoyl-CoA hydratase/isomerase family protein [unclassified Acinetobacter]|uniref:enoyl-CoA hydratase/isomerase family protein n=1 Tax=unclassified Acinetobacter TaxID=196816 RepID=UPI002934250C|nr:MULTISPECIES: enoyl-CoA hydratase/isomerase family protein [unclassified Acinetobacter]WOE32942.1 enoyl-CoA hydratase/isomerase family protein [Acinetobacter sp. SAAs470]WOE38419.1 enoyl-CoA hydratase/isomerase family protein [Acinetobacter sp. SAAs474]